MTTTELATSLADERLAPFLPLIAEAWEDGRPTDLEIAAICLAVLQLPGMDLTCKEALQRWLDPARPPAADDLAVLRAHLATTTRVDGTPTPTWRYSRPTPSPPRLTHSPPSQ